MLLPYASYLRIYEPAGQMSTPGLGTGYGDPPLETMATATLSREQHAVLTRSIVRSRSPRSRDELAGCYLLRRDSRLYICPVDLALRTWLAVTEFGDQTDELTQALIFARGFHESADEEYAAWRAANPAAMAHIRQATWGVPRTWFLLVVQEEREVYDLEGETSVRFRTSVAEAQRRLLSAFTVLNAMIDDEDLLEELSDLGRWLASFSDDCWVELDYAGVARLLGSELAEDRSASEIGSALRAIGRRDFATAGEMYRQFVERWRAVTSYERAS